MENRKTEAPAGIEKQEYQPCTLYRMEDEDCYLFLAGGLDAHKMTRTRADGSLIRVFDWHEHGECLWGILWASALKEMTLEQGTTLVVETEEDLPYGCMRMDMSRLPKTTLVEVAHSFGRDLDRLIIKSRTMTEEHQFTLSDKWKNK